MTRFLCAIILFVSLVGCSGSAPNDDLAQKAFEEAFSKEVNGTPFVLSDFKQKDGQSFSKDEIPSYRYFYESELSFPSGYGEECLDLNSLNGMDQFRISMSCSQKFGQFGKSKLSAVPSEIKVSLFGEIVFEKTERSWVMNKITIEQVPLSIDVINSELRQKRFQNSILPIQSFRVRQIDQNDLGPDQGFTKPGNEIVTGVAGSRIDGMQFAVKRLGGLNNAKIVSAKLIESTSNSSLLEFILDAESSEKLMRITRSMTGGQLSAEINGFMFEIIEVDDLIENGVLRVAVPLNSSRAQQFVDHLASVQPT